jgi:hypothetical protein
MILRLPPRTGRWFTFRTERDRPGARRTPRVEVSLTRPQGPMRSCTGIGVTLRGRRWSCSNYFQIARRAAKKDVRIP